MNLIFKYIYNVRIMFWWFVCLFSFPYFLYQKDVCEQSTSCLGSVEMTCYNEIIELMHHTADIYCVRRAAANRNGFR